MLSFKLGILVLGGRESVKEGPMVGWIRTETNFCLLSRFPLQLSDCPEELLLLQLPPLGALDEAITEIQSGILSNRRFTRQRIKTPQLLLNFESAPHLH